jgi:geranylgeranyl diphosphate/geranylgeranyl-bacteriochlorophyllide a reductase
MTVYGCIVVGRGPSRAKCDHRGLQSLLWPACMNKKLIYAKPMTYASIFFKDMCHLLQTAR